MSDYFGGQSREALEKLLRHLVAQGAEGPKVDFKATIDLDTKSGQAETAKDIASIANTDDEAHLNDVGYIIVGAERGRIVGTAWFDADCDKLQARLTEVVKNFVGPLPQFSLVTFDEPGGERWGAIVVPASALQPHVLIRDGAGVTRYEWHVRVNDTTERAAPHDFARIMAKTVRREIRPLETELARLSMRLDQQGSTRLESLADLVKQINLAPESRTETPAYPDLATRIRSELVHGDNAIEESLVTEALRLWEVMSENSDRNPLSFGDASPQKLRAILEYLEEQSFPLAMSFATIARHDKSGRYTQAVVRAISIIAKQPEPTVSHYRYAGEFRLYPVVLCLYALVMVAAKERRAMLLKEVLSVQVEHAEYSEPIIVLFRTVRASHDVFNTALEGRWYEPVPLRIRDAFIPRFLSLLSGTPAIDAFRIAEFLIALAFLPVAPSTWGEKVPMPGLYLYEYDARRTLRTFLRKKPDWISDALGVDLRSLLVDFDSGASKMVQRGGRGDGFVGGALKAYEGE